jgi:hypothetical protein
MGRGNWRTLGLGGIIKVFDLKKVHKIVFDYIYLREQWLTLVIMAMKRWIP